jgi:hypothetical protein
VAWETARRDDGTRLQPRVELLLEVDDVQARRGRGRDVLHPQRAVLDVLARGEDAVEDVLGLRLRGAAVALL